MYSSNCCFLTCKQISQEAGQVVWYFHLFQNFPQFVVVHTVKGFDIVNKVEVDVFLEHSCFFNDPADVGNLISGSSVFSKSSLNIWSSQFTYCWSLAWRILSITLLACEMSANVAGYGLSKLSSLLFLSKFNPYLMLLFPCANQLSVNEMNVSSNTVIHATWKILHAKYLCLPALTQPATSNITLQGDRRAALLWQHKSKDKEKKWQKGRKKIPTICFFLNLL